MVSSSKMRKGEEGAGIWVGENNSSVLAILTKDGPSLSIFVGMLRRHLTIRALAYIYLLLDSFLTTGSHEVRRSSHTEKHKLFQLRPPVFA